MLANTPLVKNLAIPEYTSIILLEKASLAERFSAIDVKAVRKALSEADESSRKYPKGMAEAFKVVNLPAKLALSGYRDGTSWRAR